MRALSSIVVPRRASIRRFAAVARALPAWVCVLAVVAGSAALRMVAVASQPIPRLLPDEYIYASLARSIADGRLSIRDEPARFPALLEPLLAAPFSLIGDLELAFRLTLGLHAVTMSLAAVPVYLLARRLGLVTWQSLAAAAFTVVVPAMLYASYWTAEAIAYPLALAAVAAGVAALERPCRRSQAAFLALAALAAFARVQYVVLVPAFVAGAAVVAGGSPRLLARRYRLTLTLLSGALAVVLVAGAGRVLGYYTSILDLRVDAGGIATWTALDLGLLAFASGVVLVPAAVAGLAGALRASAATTERAFAALTSFLGLALFAEAALYATNGSNRFQERYLMSLTPLVFVAALLGWRRLPRGRLLMTGTAAVLLLVSARVPLSGYAAADGKQDSPFLFAVAQVESRVGSGSGSLLVAAATATLLVLAVGAAWRPKAGVAVAVAAALAASAGYAWAATAQDAALDQSARASLYREDDPSWVDRLGLGDASVLVTPAAARAAVSTHLFWNTSLRHVLVLPGAAPPDAYGSDPVQVRPDGTLLLHGRPLRTPIFVEETQARAELAGARLVRRAADASLWLPKGEPRLSMLTEGRYGDGALAWPEAAIRIWPAGTSVRLLCLAFVNPDPATRTITLQDRAGERTLRLAPRERRVVSLPVPGATPWTATVRGRRATTSNGRLVFAHLEAPRLLPGGIGPQGTAPQCR